MPLCPRCRCTYVKQDARPAPIDQLCRCGSWRRPFTERTGPSVAGYRLPAEIILMTIRWKTRLRFSGAHGRDLLAERGIDRSERTVLTWAHVFGPLLATAACRHTTPVAGR